MGLTTDVVTSQYCYEGEVFVFVATRVTDRSSSPPPPSPPSPSPPVLITLSRNGRLIAPVTPLMGGADHARFDARRKRRARRGRVPPTVTSLQSAAGATSTALTDGETPLETRKKRGE